MQNAGELVLQFGQFAALVIVASIVMMLFVSCLDSHPRRRESNDETRKAKKNPNDYK